MSSLIAAWEWVHAWWHVLLSYGTVGLIVAGCIAAFIVLPLGPRIRLALLASAVLLVTHTVSFTVGIKQGVDGERAIWQGKERAGIKQGEDARTDADRDAADATPDELRHDQYNRDRDK